MLEIVDAGSGHRVPVAPNRARVARLCVPVGASGGALTLGGLRALVTADLVRRVLEELHERQVMLAVTGPGIDRVTLRRRLNPLWVQEPVGIAASPDGAAAALGGTIDLVVVPPDGEPAAPGGTPWLRVGPVSGPPADGASGDDATALRMSLLAGHYRSAVRAGDAELTRAAATLGRWRSLVAGWAARPSAPMPEEAVRRAYAACDADLDLPGVLAQLHRLERDGDRAEGAKFETFVHVDRILALDLAAGLGTARQLGGG